MNKKTRSPNNTDKSTHQADFAEYDEKKRLWQDNCIRVMQNRRNQPWNILFALLRYLGGIGRIGGRSTPRRALQRTLQMFFVSRTLQMSLRYLRQNPYSSGVRRNIFRWFAYESCHWENCSSSFIFVARCNRKNCLTLFYVCDFWKSEDFQFAFHILCIGSDKIGHDFRNFLKLFFEV